MDSVCFSIFIVMYFALIIFNFYWYFKLKRVTIKYFIFTPIIWMVQSIFLLFGLNFKTEYIEANERLFLVIFTFIVIMLTIQILFFVIAVLIELMKFIKYDKDFNKLSSKTQSTALIILLLIILIVPSFTFGMFYNMGLVYAQVTGKISINLDIYDYFYFAFGINFSLPMTGTLEDLQKLINVNFYLRTLQIVHVVSGKILEMVIIGFIITKISKLLDKDKDREDYYISEEIKRLYKLRNQKIISNEQYEKLKLAILNKNISDMD
ncbi:hypothetical protein MKY85_07830 [Paenibacillus sp. FSL R5-0749]|uniref:hypothetical protein n=1 Tax=Paenibacillus sp. FSL R5-0749 TaxID=2921657 RepID=UPI00315A9C9E